MLIEQKVENIITEPLSSRGFELVRIKFAAKILQIMIEKDGGKPVSVADCEKVSGLVSILLETEEVITSNYNLEVSSPGLDRPLTKIEDYHRFIGKDIKLALIREVNDRRKLKGKILSVKESIIEIHVIDDEEPITIEYENILSANLMVKIDFSKK